MKRIIIAIIFFCPVSLCFSQQNPVKIQRKEDMKVLRQDIKTERATQRKYNEEKRIGNYSAAAQYKAEMSAERKKVLIDGNTLKNEGVKHPIKRADRQIEKEKRGF